MSVINLKKSRKRHKKFKKAKEKNGDPRAKKPATTPGKPRHELTEEEIQARLDSRNEAETSDEQKVKVIS